MPIYSPTGFLDITNATLRTSNTECQNLQIGSGNVYVTTDLTSNLVLNLENITNLGATTSNTVVFSNVTTGLTVSSNIVATGNVTAGSFLGDGSGLTAVPAAQITGTLDAARIPALDTAKITTGTLDAARIPALDTAKITTGTLDAARIPTLNQNTTGSAGSATTAGTAATLTTARSIGGVSFDGSAAIVPTTFNGATFSGDVGIGTTTPGAPLEVHGPDLTGEAAGTTSLISRHVSGLDGVLNIFGVAAGNGEETLGLQTQIDNRAWATDIAGGWSTGNASRYNLLLQPYKGNVGIGTTTPQQKLEVHGNILLGQNDINSFIHNGANMALSADTDIMIVSDANLTTGDPGGDIIFGAGSAINMNTNRDFTFAQAYPSSVPRLEHMRILGSNGNVGIGTTSPGYQLDLQNISKAQMRIKSNATSGDGDAILHIDSSQTGESDIDFMHDGVLNWRLRTGDASGTNFQIHDENDASAFAIKQNGNVGIGTTTPQQKLEVHGNILCGENNQSSFIHGGGIVAVTSDSTILIVCDSNDQAGAGGNDIIFGYGSAADTDGLRSFTYDQAFPLNVPRVETMRIETDTGRVGIGTTTPGSSLHVNLGNAAGEQHIRVTQTSLASSSKAGIRFGDSTWDAFIDHDHGDKDRMNFGFYRNPTREVQMVLTHEGNVGIGTTTPRNKLEIKTTGSDSGLLHLYKTTGNGVGIDFCDQASFAQRGFLRYHHQDSQAFGAGNCFRFSSTEALETLVVGGSLQIGVDGKDNGAALNGRKNLFLQGTFGGNTSQSHGWWLGPQNQAYSSSDNDLYFNVVRNGTIKECAAIIDQNNSTINFTGQHRTFVKGVPTKQLEDKEGLIVIADQNEFIKMSGGVAYGNDAITVNESLPVVSFSTKAKDKRCFGVISTTEDPETRKEVYGNFASTMRKEEGDTRVYVNSVGEGAIWVTDTNGTLESGDYITTSNVSAYGMKQDDDLLHNYTVAKILMDCDFNPTTQPKRIIKKEAKMIDYWIRYGDVKITEEEYTTLPETKRKIIEDVHYRIDQMDVLKEDPEKDSFVYEQREDMVNVLDEHGEFQWEDTDETEKAYKIRYLDANGVITDEANAVHTAAFVGCTYHCG